MADSRRPSISRRAFFAALGGATACVAGLGTWASPSVAFASETITKIEKGKTGVTLWLSLENGMFPAKGESYDDPTTIVFVPNHYRVLDDAAIDAVVHFHGHRTTAADAMREHRLREQLVDSKQNAILIMPQGPVNASDSSGGKLEKAGAFNDFLREVRLALQSKKATQALGKAFVPSKARFGTVCVSAHSGGYRVAAKVCEHGGFDVREVYLFDALYGEVEAFRDWIAARKKDTSSKSRHKLISYYAKGRVLENNEKLMAELDDAGIKYALETKEGELSRAEITKARVVFIKTSLSHGRLTYKNNSLRDCLFASALKRRLDADWFDDKNGKRDLDVRED